MFKTVYGATLDFGTWHTVGRCQIRPMVQGPWWVRLGSNPEWKIKVTRATPAGRDALEAALCYQREPASYLAFNFGADRLAAEPLPLGFTADEWLTIHMALRYLRDRGLERTSTTAREVAAILDRIGTLPGHKDV